jgi:hypothetical protein
MVWLFKKNNIQSKFKNLFGFGNNIITKFD